MNILRAPRAFPICVIHQLEFECIATLETKFADANNLSKVAAPKPHLNTDTLWCAKLRAGIWTVPRYQEVSSTSIYKRPVKVR